MTKPCSLVFLIAAAAAAQAPSSLKLRISWGHGVQGAPLGVRVEGAGVRIEQHAVHDGLECSLAFPPREISHIPNLHVIWADLIAHSDADTVRRLTHDPAYRIDDRKVTIIADAAGRKGFSVTVDQLLQNPAIWVPPLGIYLNSGDREIPFEEHMASLAPFRGQRILDRLRAEPEATYEQYAALWENMGDPNYRRQNQRPPGHIICVSWDSAIPKFGIDRGGGIWNDYGNPDHFRLWFDFADLTQTGLTGWKGQRLDHGLPVVLTTWERDGVRYEIEQFAYPLDGPPAERRGDIRMVLFGRVRLTDLSGRARTVPLTLYHQRAMKSAEFAEGRRGKAWLLEESGSGSVLLDIEGADEIAWSGVHDYQKEMRRADITLPVQLPASGTRELTIKLPSPALEGRDAETLVSLAYEQAREATTRYWSTYIARGARFEVPDEAVNELYRANLWHALRLPRRHGPGASASIDLPYSNFAYTQTGTPWPVNQAVYMDYMLYDLRGYHGIAAEELAAMYRNNQQPDGHLGGNANWLVYTPGMLYAVAKNYALSGDRAALEKLLPASLRAMEWCVRQVREAAGREGPGQGLVNGELNDLTGKGLWAFNQAYLFAGLDEFAKTLESIGHPRAAECRSAAEAIHTAIGRGFHNAAVFSPLVQLRDHTWIPYVPSEATTYGRLLNTWYPTDVDTGALHLVRLGALPAEGDLADYLLQDHEDNLFLRGLGVANEPVYNQNATALLLRDDVPAAIRAFYSLMASGFSQAVFEPVEHRWMHGQYFGPPSTDGAWAELYRNMLIREAAGGTLFLGQAVPRRWLRDGKRIEIERAPTDYGLLSLRIESRAARGEIEASVSIEQRKTPQVLLVRLRHPDAKPIRAAVVNGSPYGGFDAKQEWIRIPAPRLAKYTIIARY